MKHNPHIVRAIEKHNVRERESAGVCHKRCYRSHAKAAKRLRSLKQLQRKERAIYYCAKCTAFHLTSQKEQSS